MRKDDKITKLLHERTKYMKKCRCGHSVVFYPFVDKKKKLCSWCGYYIYADEKTEFLDKLNKTMGHLVN